MTAPTIRIVIVDDDLPCQKALFRLLQTNSMFQVVAQAENGLAALQEVEKHRPDVVLMDIKMPVMDGLETTKIITSKFPDTR